MVLPYETSRLVLQAQAARLNSKQKLKLGAYLLNRDEFQPSEWGHHTDILCF